MSGVMKRVKLHQNSHPFDSHPFEAFWSGSWKPIKQLQISNSVMKAHIVDNIDVIEEEIPSTNFRVRSRKATSSDCRSFLRPGIDICAPVDDKINVEPFWIDAKIRSIERKPHNDECDCNFYISYYINQGPDLILENKKVRKEMSMIKINQMCILQNVEKKPCEDQYYRWGSSEDCYLVPKIKGQIYSDLAWLLVASALKPTVFDIRSIHNHIVYEISGNYSRDVAQASCAVNFKVENDIFTPVVLQIVPEGSDGHGAGSSASHDVVELRRSKRRAVQPDRYLGCDNLPDYDIEVTRVCENKTYVKLEYDEIKLEYDDNDGDDDDEYFENRSRPCKRKSNENFQTYVENQTRPSKRKSNENSQTYVENWTRPYKRKSNENFQTYVENRPRPYKRKSDENFQTYGVKVNPSIHKHNNTKKSDFSNFKAPKDEPVDIHDMVSEYSDMNASSSHNRKTFGFKSTERENVSRGAKSVLQNKYQNKSSNCGSSKRDCFYVQESSHNVRNYNKCSATAQLCRDLIKRCMENIDETLKNSPKQWEEFPSTKNSNRREEDQKEIPSTNNEEMSEIDMLWKEMDFALASWYLLDDNEDSYVQPPPEVQKSTKNGENICEHDYRLDEQVGTVCRLCGFVETEIKDILPPFIYPAHWSSNKEHRANDDDPDHKKTNEEVEICAPSNSTSSVQREPENNVWALIPDLGSRLRAHQRKAFRFLWRNIAGSLLPSQMEKRKNKRGGCVISHSPGAGKTLLIIAFLVSYLKLFPGSRPLVLAPKTTLYTWYKEIIKWEVPIPVYQIHGSQTFRNQVSKHGGIKLSSGVPRNLEVMHVIDCLEKMQKWLSNPSILLMGYTSFLTLTNENSKHAHRKYMAQLLKQCPGILILDEGHNPRSTNSRLRKGLMKVDTRLRVLLSGTLFQNNFGEYFNTLCLARPRFVGEVIKELDPKHEERNEERETQFSLENRGRRLMIAKIAKKIDSNKGEEREQALKTLKELTGKFIDVYEGGNSDKLPGLECYTLMMKSTTLQQKILSKLQNQRGTYKGSSLTLEFLIMLTSIHPCLISSTSSSKPYFTSKELKDVEKFKFDIKSGSKVLFVMTLIPRCLIGNEKVLIFCHHIAPINLFLQIFEKFYNWHKGTEVLVLQGDMELFERGRVMEKFEENSGPSKVMLASISACSEGISLTAASRVILLDSEWNPSKSKQAIARAFRPGQNKVVYVYQLFASGTLEEEKHSRTTWKEWVSDMILNEERVEDHSPCQAKKIEDEILREIVEDDCGAMFHHIRKNEKALNVIRGKGVHG